MQTDQVSTDVQESQIPEDFAAYEAWRNQESEATSDDTEEIETPAEETEEEPEAAPESDPDEDDEE